MPAANASDPPSTSGQWDLTKRSEKRSLILCGAGAIVGLLLAGAGLFTAQGTHIAGVPPEDVALINGVPILLSDYQTQLTGIYNLPLSQATPDEKRKVLNEMIREELYVQRGIELGLQNDVIEVRTALVGAVEGQQAIDAAASQPDDATLLEFYQAHREKYASEGSITLTDFLAPNLDSAQKSLAALNSGQPIKDVARSYGLTPTTAMADGEEFYFAAKIHLGDRLFEAARKVPSGAVSNPVPIGNTIHLLAVSNNVPPVVQPFSLVRDLVLNDYRADKTARMQAGADSYLRRRADVQIAKGYE